MERLQKNIHLTSRATFGTALTDIKTIAATDTSALVQKILSDSTNYEPLTEVQADEEQRPMRRSMSKTELEEAAKTTRADLMQLNLAWIKKMQTDKHQLRERMTFFWHGHFACRVRFPFMAQSLNNDIRKHALGKFGDLLLAVSKSPAMLLFLNNQQNRKAQANENFARELLELFTLGRGHYTEADVKAAARSFTGWAFNRRTGEFELRHNQHDEGEKAFINERGNFSGDDIIRIILKQKQTAVFIVEKIFRHFVNENIDSGIVQQLADDFFESEYDIGKLMFNIFSSTWFYDSKNVGAKIKSPVELLVSINRMFEPQYENEKFILRIQQALGQVLFFPPNVAGWPGGRLWIDSSSLLFRLKLPAILLNNGVMDFDVKDQMDDEMLMKPKQRIPLAAKVSADWEVILKNFSTLKSESELQTILMSKIPAAWSAKQLPEYNELNCKEYILALLSMPEYQLT